MVIQHNISSINALRNTKLNNNDVSKNLEKLSSGFRINHAADDAAGLAISEKMRGQIRGLDRAGLNIQDGISLIHTADGAMQEDHSILQRIRELLVQGSNGTYDNVDKEAIQKEIDSLMREIDDLSHRADFNGIKVLRGGYDTDPEDVYQAFDIAKFMNPKTGVMEIDSFTAPPTPDNSTGSFTNTAQATIDFSNVKANNVNNLVGQGFYQTCCTCDIKYSIAFNDQGINAKTTVGNDHILNIDITGITNGKDLVARIAQVVSSTGYNNHLTQFVVDERDPTGQTLLIHDNRNNQAPDVARGRGMFGVGVWDNPTNDPNYTPDIPEIDGYNYVPVGLPIQAGANKGEHIEIKLPWVDTKSLNLNGRIAIDPIAVALKSIDYLDAAINTLSGFRADMGATQNRLEHAQNNVKNSSENLAAAESRIRDADMAKEMMEFTKNSILAQSSQSMLAQSNQLPQGVLNLLKAA